jgi:hypothetical protein
MFHRGACDVRTCCMGGEMVGNLGKQEMPYSVGPFTMHRVCLGDWQNV